MKIAINGLSILPRNAGVGKYFLQLIEAVSAFESEKVEWQIVLREDYWAMLSPSFKEKLALNPKVKVSTLRPQDKILNFFKARQITRGANTTVFADYYPYTLYAGRLSVIVHDLHFQVHPETFRFVPRNFRRLVFWVYRFLKPRIFTISERTSREISLFYPYLFRDIFLIGSGSSIDTSSIQPFPELEEKKYILTVGTLNKHKNYERLISAYMIASSIYGLSRPPCDIPSLVIIGRPGNNRDIIGELLLHVQAAEQKIEWFSNLTDGQMAWAYINARGVVLPSSYEGYGLPLAEALILKRPVACSRIDAFVDIAGNEFAYFEFDDVVSIASRILDLMLQKIPVFPIEGKNNLAFDEVPKRLLQCLRDA